MAGEKGRFRRIADAVTGAVVTVVDGVRGASGPGAAPAAPDPKPQPKATRKAAQKATIARAAESRQKATDAVRAARRHRA
jgi:hypothetical protein